MSQPAVTLPFMKCHDLSRHCSLLRKAGEIRRVIGCTEICCNAFSCSSMNIFVHLHTCSMHLQSLQWLQWFRVEALGWYQILWFIGLIEGSGFFSGKYGLGFMKDATMSGTPGDYGVGFPTFLGKVSDPAVKKSKLNAELANGRLAMMAIIGMFFQDGVVLSVLHVLGLFFACWKHASRVMWSDCHCLFGISKTICSAFSVIYCTIAEHMCCRTS